jgi:PAS domain-containing protein
MAATMEYRYEVLAQRSEALRIIFESLPWGVIVADLEGRLLFSNPAAERILGIGNVEVLPDTRMALEGAIRGEKIVDELIFVHNSQPRPGVLDPSKRVAPERLCRNGFRRVVIFHDFTQGRNAL